MHKLYLPPRNKAQMHVLVLIPKKRTKKRTKKITFKRKRTKVEACKHCNQKVKTTIQTRMATQTWILVAILVICFWRKFNPLYLLLRFDCLCTLTICVFLIMFSVNVSLATSFEFISY